MAEKTNAERIKGLQDLSEKLDAMCKKAGETCIAAAAEMSSVWRADRNADRRVLSTTYHPERRRHSSAH